MSKTCIIDKHGDRRCGERLGGLGSDSRLEFPTVGELTKILRQVAMEYEGDPEIEEIDVRLQVTDGGWDVHTGDASYDTDHNGYWGAATIDNGNRGVLAAEEIAEDLIGQAKDAAASDDQDVGDFEGLGARRDRMKLPPEVAGDPAATFFWEHGGYGVATGEPRSKARARMALDLAASEREARERGWRVSWEEDPEPDSCQYQDEDGSWHNADECLWAALYDEDGEQLASLGGIGFVGHSPEDRKHKRDYMRVVEAELASEALYELRRKTGAGPTTPRYEGRQDPNLLRSVRFQPYRKGQGPTFTLNVWDTGRTDEYGKLILRYKLTQSDRGEIFSGSDFHLAPGYTSDGDEMIKSLMSFLTLQPGDTDEDYFKDYTKEQFEFADKYAEALNTEVGARFGFEE